jgi:hypothetical protein
MTDAQRAIVRHLRERFPDRDVEAVRVDEGPVEERVPGFSVVRVAPGDNGLWLYVSSGAWDAVHTEEHGLEFCLLAADADDHHPLLLAMAAYYHANDDESFRLDHGHTVPLGGPWLPGSSLDHLLVSLPYPLGPDFEMCHWDGGHARILWLLPITQGERDFRAREGLEALEQRFESGGIRYWDPGRAPVA